MRNIVEVLEKMLAEVPKADPAYEALARFRRNLSYQPPERWEYWGHKLSLWLNEQFPDPAALADWQLNIVRIWMDNPNVTREDLVSGFRSKLRVE